MPAFTYFERRTGQSISFRTTTAAIHRPLSDLLGYLSLSQSFPSGCILLTGTGIVPSTDFTLQPGDVTSIHIDDLGELRNTVEHR
jgi:2-dehydro-3-deoxy-D-arabinonate dehydratase